MSNQPPPFPDTGIVIAHYHPAGRVARHLLNFIQHARRHVTPHIVFVSTGLSDPYKALIESHCHVIQRENVGYDFWSYKIGLESLMAQARPWQRLLIINSSIVITNPALLAHQLFARPLGSGLVGVGRSRQPDDHLQSYCILFEGEPFIRSAAMQRWWAGMEPISERKQVILKYEVGMSQYFLAQGVALDGLYKPTQKQRLMAIVRALHMGTLSFDVAPDQNTVSLDLSYSEFMNPTWYMWKDLLQQFGIVKIDFLKKSPLAPDLHRLIQRLPPQVSGPLHALIDDALI